MSQKSDAAHALPAQPSLDYLRKRAKEKLRQLIPGHPTAKLAEAQRLIAQEHGFRSWRALHAHVTALAPTRRLPPKDVIQAFAEALYRDGGDVDAVRALLDEHPALVHSRPWRPRWEGTALSAIAGMCVWHRPKMRQNAQLLVERGADADLPTLARCGLLDAVQRKLATDPTLLDQPDAQGRTALFRAICVYGSFDEGEAVAQWLIDQGAAIDLGSAATLGLVERVRDLLAGQPELARARDGDGMTALHWAVRQRKNRDHQDLAIARLLLDAGADVAAINPQEDGMHPLHHCGEWMATPEVADLLIERGAAVNARAEKTRWTPLDYAIDRNRMPMIDYFRNRGGKRSSELDTPDESPTLFFKAIWAGETATVQRMLAENPALAQATAPHPQWAGRPQALHLAIERGDTVLLNVLLDAGAPVDGENREYDGWSPLMLALHWQRPPLAQALIARGATLELIPALMLEDDARVDALLERDPWALQAPMPNRATPLHFARTRHATERLLKAGIEPKAQDKHGLTAMDRAVKLGPAGREVVLALMERGITPTPLDLARLGKLKELQKALTAETDLAPLLRAAIEGGQLRVVSGLLKRGAAVNARDTKGVTPLHTAAWEGRLPIVKRLVEAGADLQARDGEYDATPAQWAWHNLETHGRTPCLKVAEFLESHTGQPRSPRAAVGPQPAWKPIMDAAFAGDSRKIQALIDQGADPNALSTTNHRHRPLHRAIERKKIRPRGAQHQQAAEVLLAAGADPTLRGTHGMHTALQLAAIDSPSFVPMLRDRFQPLDFWHACVMLDVQRVTAMLKNKPALAQTRDENQWLPLHYVAASSLALASPEAAAAQQVIVAALLAAGADVNGTYAWHGSWPIPILYYACGYHENPALTEYLLQRGALPYDNESVYHASDEGHTACLAVIARYADPKKLQDECTKCLRTQAHWGRTRGMAWLLAHGADPNALYPGTGLSALHAAAKRGASEQVITLLLGHGADPTRPSRDGKTAVDLAKTQALAQQLTAATRASETWAGRASADRRGP